MRRAVGLRPGVAGLRGALRRGAARQSRGHVRCAGDGLLAGGDWSLACYTRTRRWPWLAGAAVGAGVGDHYALGVRAAGQYQCWYLYCSPKWTKDEGRRDEGQHANLYSSSVFRLSSPGLRSVTERGVRTRRADPCPLSCWPADDAAGTESSSVVVIGTSPTSAARL